MEKYDITKPIKIPVGMHKLNDDPSISFQLNRLVNMDGCDLAIAQEIGPTIKTAADFYDHEEDHNLKELTDNLITFFKCCKSQKIGYIPSIEEREQLLIKNGKEANITDSLRKAWQSEIELYGDMVQEKVIID